MAFFPACRNAFRATRTLALACLLCLFAACAQAAAPVDKEFRAQLERVLKENPVIILDILKDNSETVLEIAQQGNMLRKRKALMAQWETDATQHKTPDLAGRAFRGGGANAPVTVVAYSDYTCPYCRQAELTLAQLLKKYDGSIRLTFKILPKEDPLSQAAAKYATAAFMTDPAKGWEFSDALFNGVDQFERDGETFLKATAAKTGLDFKKLKTDAGSLKVQERLDADRAEADKMGISGTPYFLVNDLLVRGAVSKDLFEDAIEMALRLTKKK